ncbi:outer membrane beta-barrel protein [Bradyrhizobium sp. 157]|uniref:outer membrane protein n=1 Tax=Bradyrhizobium sp. 157 TaxID=2782631 RepID=UPI001FFB4587
MSANCTAGPNLFATGTGRVGYAFGALGHTLAYLKGGVAWQYNQGNVLNNNEYNGLQPQENTHLDYGQVGGAIGLGVEQALTPAWSVKVEYDYLHFGGPSVATPSTVQFPPFAILPANMTSLSSNYHIGKMGLKYHFGADPWAAQWVRCAAVRESTCRRAADCLQGRLVVRRRIAALAQPGTIPMGRQRYSR